MHHARTYSYDDQSGTGYLPSQYPQQYARGYQSPQGSGQYYVQPGDNMEAPESGAYYRSMTPMVSSTDRYTASGHQQYYQSSSNGSTSSQADPSAYHTQSPYYASQYQRSQTPAIQNHEATQFIPTPSELYVYSPRQISMPAQASAADPYTSTPFTTAHPFVPSSRSPEQRPSRIATGRPMTSPGSPITSPSGERFPCEKCGKTFSRSHDRKRHHETQHLSSPVIHRCRYCEKEFSRADSLKRHLDNGCDEMPS